MEEFESFLNRWVDSINNRIELPTNTPHIILDNEVFSFDSQTGYSVKKDDVKRLLNTKICFIGDNPGDNESKNTCFFYYEPDDDKRDERRAGSKIHKLREQIGMENVFYFNKCLIHTKKTSDLKADQINSTSDDVVDFLNHISDINKDIIFLFFGVNKKFSKIYSQLNRYVVSKSVLYYHPCSSKYSETQLLEKFREGKLIELNLNSEKHFFKVFGDEDDGLAGSVCIAE